jgi:NADPH-dependent ferric siderophore reductase
MQRIRRHLYETLGVERARATARGYWKHGRSASNDG